MFISREPLQGVLGNTGTGAFISREQGILSRFSGNKGTPDWIVEIKETLICFRLKFLLL